MAGGEESTCQCRRHRCDPRGRKTPWRRKWQPTLVCLPGESPGQRSLVGLSPWVPESAVTEGLNSNMTDQQCCDGFRGTAQALRHTYTCIRYPPNPSHPGCPATVSEFPMLYSRSWLAIHVKHSSVHIPLSMNLRKGTCYHE